MSLKPGFFTLLSVFTAFLLLTTGCGRPTKKTHFQTGYFDLEEYMAGQYSHLWKTNVGVAKNVFLNGKNEYKEMTFDSAKWKAELASFSEADINKPAYIKRYSVDTIRQSDSITCVDYKALDDNLRTRELKVCFTKQNGTPVKVEAQLKSNKIFYHSQEFITYTHGVGYDIAGKQDVVFSKPDTFAIHAVFKP